MPAAVRYGSLLLASEYMKPIIAILDSGIDASLAAFYRADGSSRILAYYDVAGNFYTADTSEIPRSPGDEHGTRVAYASLLEASDETDLLIIRISAHDDYAGNTAIIMTGMDYALRFASGLNRPLIINLSYGSDNGPHDNTSLFEQYIDSLCYNHRVTFTIAAGNNALSARHAKFNNSSCEFFIGNNEQRFNLFGTLPPFNIPAIRLYAPDETYIDISEGYSAVTLYNQTVYCVLNGPTPYSMGAGLNISVRNPLDNPAGIWRLTAAGISDEALSHLWIYEGDSLTSDCYFLRPDPYNTITIPSTAAGCICVGALDNLTETVAPYSGRGYGPGGLIKPDLVSVNGGGINSSVRGTSFSAPYVAGIIASLISDKNDPYLYGERLRSALLSYFNANLYDITPETGYAVVK